MFGLYILLSDIYILFLAFNSVSMRFKNIPNMHPSGNLAQKRQRIHSAHGFPDCLDGSTYDCDC